MVIADDHPYVRDGLSSMLENSVGMVLAGVAANGEQLLQIVERQLPDVVITDIRMPVIEDFMVCERIQQAHPATALIALCADDSEYFLLRLLEAGVKGILLKKSERAETIAAIKEVYFGRKYFCKNSRWMVQQFIAAGWYHPQLGIQRMPLNTKETQVLELICAGKTSKEIATETGKALRTIEDCRDKLFEKTGTTKMVGLMRWAVRNGF